MPIHLWIAYKRYSTTKAEQEDVKGMDGKKDWKYLLSDPLEKKNADLCLVTRSRSVTGLIWMLGNSRGFLLWLQWSATVAQNYRIVSLFPSLECTFLLFASSSFFLSLGSPPLDLKWSHLTWIGFALHTNPRGLIHLKGFFFSIVMSESPRCAVISINE